MSSLKVLINRIFTPILLFTVLAYFLKNVLWPLTFIFWGGYIISIIFFIFLKGYKKIVYDFIKDFFEVFILLMILIIVYAINIDLKNLFLFKEIARPILLFTLFYLGYDKLREGKIYIEKYKLVDVYIVILAVISFLNLLHIIFPVLFSSHIFRLLNISNDISIAYDPNLLCLMIIYGFIIMFNDNFNLRFNKRYNNTITIILTFIFVSNILLSASRRGLFIFAIIVSIQTFYTIRYLFTNSKTALDQKKIGTSIVLWVAFITIGFGLLKVIPKERIRTTMTKYTSFVGINDPKYIERLLWEKKLKEKSRDEIIIDKSSFSEESEYWQHPEKSGNISIVDIPYGKGYRLKREHDELDFTFLYKGPQIIYYSNHTYLIKFKIKFIKGGKSSFQLGWYANDGGRGYKTQSIIKKFTPLDNEWYECSALYTFIDNHIGINGFITHINKTTDLIIADFSLTDLDYDITLPQYVAEAKTLRRIDEYIDSINKPLINYHNLINNGDFEYGLKYWAFNADSVEINLVESDSLKFCQIRRGNGNGVNWSLIYTGRAVTFYADNEYQISFKLKLVSPKNNIPFNIGYWVNEGDGYIIDLNPSIDTLYNGWLNIKVYYKFKNTQKNIGYLINSQKDYSEFYIRDISLVNLTRKQNIHQEILRITDNNQKSQLFGDRSERWLYAFNIWKTEYNWLNKLFGKGFNFLNQFSEEFTNNTRPDYPHNPFISILLYSGLVGLIIYLIVLLRVFHLYLMFKKRVFLIFVFFAITLIFSFFSGLNPFDPPIMGFFLLVPYIFKYLNSDQPYTESINNLIGEDTNNGRK